MSAAELVERLRRKGVELWVVDGARLRYRALHGTLAPDEIGLLAEHKTEVIELLAERPATRPDRTLPLAGAAFGPAARDWARSQSDPYARHVAPFRGFVFERLGTNKTFVRGTGCYLIDEAGRRFADFVAQYGAVPFGHDPDAIWRAVTAVRDSGEPNLTAMSIQRATGELAAALLTVAPPGFEHAIFANSGAEAVEIALKLAHASTGRTGILSSRNGFHGLTLGGMSATGRAFFQQDFGAPAAGFDLIPFGDLDALAQTLAAGPDFYAAFIVEPIQGEGGIHVAPPGYLAGARELCRRHGVLFVADEVQTGLGRTGRLFACEHDDLQPDILVVAKALGGGLVPIGACLSREHVYSDAFDLRHSSTFAGNTLACRVGLAVLDALTAEDGRLVRDVAERGERLRAGLEGVRDRFPDVIVDVRGRGLMLGVELGLDGLARRQCGLLASLHEQGLLLQIVVGYLLCVEHLRVAAAVAGECVLRVEPPLIVGEEMCDDLVAAVGRLAAVLQAGDAHRLLGYLVGTPGPTSDTLVAAPRRIAPTVASVRFAFVVHLLDRAAIRHADPSLAAFADVELADLVGRIAEFREPVPVGELVVKDPTGRSAVGELVLLPLSAAEMLALAGRDAVRLVQRAVDMAASRGAEVVGLGGFTSIVADGGLALRPPAGVAITSGNSLTAWSACAALESACARRGLLLNTARVAVVGAAGAIGHALSLLCAERVGELVLVGRKGAAERLRGVAADCARHVARRADDGARFPASGLAGRMAASDEPAEMIMTTDRTSDLRDADVVITATSAPGAFLAVHDLGHGAIVLDCSRPFNLDPDVVRGRPDLTVLPAGLVRAPGDPVLGALADATDPCALVACASETVVLALSGLRSSNLCGRLDPDTIDRLGRLAGELGFTVSVDTEQEHVG